MIVPGKALGKRGVLSGNVLNFQSYIAPNLPSPPNTAGYYSKIPSWPMYGNDTLNDCVPAALAHMVQVWTSASASEVDLSNQDVLSQYERVGGYVPGNAATDNGEFILMALQDFQSKGIGGQKSGAYGSLPITQQAVMQGVMLFGCVLAGFQMPISAAYQNTTWIVPLSGTTTGPGVKGSWGGHCVPIIGYSNKTFNRGGKVYDPGVKVVSWGATYFATWSFLSAYADEYWAVLSPAWVNGTIKAPNGLNLPQLQADLSKLT